MSPRGGRSCESQRWVPDEGRDLSCAFLPELVSSSTKGDLAPLETQARRCLWVGLAHSRSAGNKPPEFTLAQMGSGASNTTAPGGGGPSGRDEGSCRVRTGSPCVTMNLQEKSPDLNHLPFFMEQMLPWGPIRAPNGPLSLYRVERGARGADGNKSRRPSSCCSLHRPSLFRR